MSQSATPAISAAATAALHGVVAARLVDTASDPIPRSVYDALTDLFLDKSTITSHALLPTVVPAPPNATSGPERGGPSRCVRIEGVVLGNVPVLASAWVTQYAREVALENRSMVAMLRCRSGLFTLELVGQPAAAVHQPGLDSDTAPSESLDRAILAALQAAAWIVCSDTEAFFGEYLREGLLDGVTLLTGADEPAIVACYRNLKSLVTSTSSEAHRATINPSTIRLAVMGSTNERAQDAAQRLEKASETFLGRRPGRTVCISRIGGAAVRTLFRGSDPRTVDEVLDLVRAVQTDLPKPVAPEVEPTPSPTAAPGGDFAETAKDVSRDAARPLTPYRPLPDTLSAHIPGLVQLPHRCPYAPDVELAVDAERSLHLLHRAGPSAAPVIVQLLTARAWAVMHAQMLRAACPELCVETPTRSGPVASDPCRDAPTMHAFTDHPKDVRGLLDTDVRLHLLARASSPDADGRVAEVWVCRDLN